jgi:hypothetical protein
MSMFISVQRPQTGGSFGFPDLNWLLVEEPEILVWPNISPRNQNQKVSLDRMDSEQLPVVEGSANTYSTIAMLALRSRQARAIQI